MAKVITPEEQNILEGRVLHLLGDAVQTSTIPVNMALDFDGFEFIEDGLLSVKELTDVNLYISFKMDPTEAGNFIKLVRSFMPSHQSS